MQMSIFAYWKFARAKPEKKPLFKKSIFAGLLWMTCQAQKDEYMFFETAVTVPFFKVVVTFYANSLYKKLFTIFQNRRPESDKKWNSQSAISILDRICLTGLWNRWVFNLSNGSDKTNRS